MGIKQNLSQGAPVVIGMMEGGTFMTKVDGKDVWYQSSRDYDKRGFGGHAMCVISYNDYKTGKEGAFQIMNSSDERWGKKECFGLSIQILSILPKKLMDYTQWGILKSLLQIS